MKQAPRSWNSRIDKYFRERKYVKCPYEHALCIKMQVENILIICLCVDDPCIFYEFKKEMTKEFEMTDIGCHELLS